MSEPPAAPSRARFRGCLLALALVPAGIGAARTLYVLAARCTYPYHLEFLETNLFAQAVDLRAGGALYGDPAHDFVPHEYGPLHPFLLSLLFRIVEPSLTAARALSTAASIATALLLALWAHRAGGRLAGAVLACTLYLALFGTSGCWYDVARVDSLAILLLVAGTTALHAGEAPGRTRLAAGATLLVLSAFAKQTTIPIAGAAILLAPTPLRRRAIAFAGWAGALAGIGLALQASTGGRFLLYTVAVPLSHPLHWNLWRGLGDLLASPPYLALPLLAALAVSLLARSQTQIAPARRLGALFCVALGVSIVSLFKEGAWVNDLMPALAFGAAAAARGLDRALTPEARTPGSLATCGALALVPLGGWFDASDPIPVAADRRTGHALVEYLRAFPGRLWVADFNYLPVLAGKPPLPTAYAIGEMVEPLGVSREDVRALERGEFDLVLADPGTPASFRRRLLPAYRRDERMPSLPADLRTRTGQRIGLAEVWVPRDRPVSLPPFPPVDSGR